MVTTMPVDLEILMKIDAMSGGLHYCAYGFVGSVTPTYTGGAPPCENHKGETHPGQWSQLSTARRTEARTALFSVQAYIMTTPHRTPPCGANTGLYAVAVWVKGGYIIKDFGVLFNIILIIKQSALCISERYANIWCILFITRIKISYRYRPGQFN